MAGKPNVLIIGAVKTHYWLVFGTWLDQRRPRDWGVTAHWAIKFLDLYPDGMETRLQDAQVIANKDPKQQEHVLFHDGQTGESIKTIPLGPARRYSQRKIRQALVNGLEEVIQYHKALQEIRVLSDGVEVSFADGTSASGSIVVACDGSQSDTRQHLFEEKEDALWKPIPGFVLNNFWMQYTREQALEVKSQLSHFMDIAVHPNGTYYGLIPLDISDMDKPETWKFQIFMAFASDLKPEEDAPEKRFELVKEAGKAFVNPFSLGIEYMPEGTYINPDRYGIWETKQWDHKGGRVILAGDAAHAMTAHRAQGLNHALQDVLNIVSGMKDVQNERMRLEDFVKTYVDEVVERGSNEVRMSRAQGMAVHNWGKSKDMPILKIGTTPLHMERSVVPLPSS
ncbi:hypothetical protein PFICI_05087 [Pestalotiopsis fici W106-1]|uniref:FAD-binding domain-containing protein n=1 Tax=Pestalotiopsis fici (strain W106-1 / CGMCC3.15140) TaxID=1229662 RepID=W3XDF7_PESFW|nr:uncharacterized protein PFICI_05087 [Pestalotiopsis fici W106-1]ETS83211.1 hypothetical protein PFICI_05087 [Pestalotiopsis fici W106-1]